LDKGVRQGEAMMQLSAHKRRVWPLVLSCTVAGVLLGAILVIAAPLFVHRGAQAPPLPQPAKHVAGRTKSDGPNVSGNLFATIKTFTLEDPEGNTVLRVAELGGFVDLDAMGDSELVHMPRGHARDVELLLRRGPSGRVSLSEAFRGNSEPHEPKLKRGGTALQIGPLQVKNVKLTVAMGKSPVVIHIDHAVVRVQRKRSDLAPRVFLAEVHGNLVSPDPLHQPIAIEGAEGVIDLAGDPLVDMRARVCIGDSEMRIRIEMPERHTQVRMTVDAHGALAGSALMALNVVSMFKADKLGVTSGSVSVDEPFDCTRSKGRDRRAAMEATSRAEANDAGANDPPPAARSPRAKKP